MKSPGKLGRHPERPRHRGLDRGDVAHDDDVAPCGAGADAVGTEQLVARRGDAVVDLDQRLTPSRAKRRITLPLAPYVGWDVTEGLAVVLAVVHLDPSVIHLDGHAGRQERRRVTGPAERAGPQRQDRIAQQTG